MMGEVCKEEHDTCSEGHRAEHHRKYRHGLEEPVDGSEIADHGCDSRNDPELNHY